MDDLLSRITIDPAICHGQPCIKGTRIMVYLILELLEAGIAPEQIVQEYYPQLTEQDVQACLRKGAS
jgi:uncharacterized protein (DUF433 family)